MMQSWLFYRISSTNHFVVLPCVCVWFICVNDLDAKTTTTSDNLDLQELAFSPKWMFPCIPTHPPSFWQTCLYVSLAFNMWIPSWLDWEEPFSLFAKTDNSEINDLEMIKRAYGTNATPEALQQTIDGKHTIHPLLAHHPHTSPIDHFIHNNNYP